jgi:branched-chain amino acid transport system permease protein
MLSEETSKTKLNANNHGLRFVGIFKQSRNSSPLIALLLLIVAATFPVALGGSSNQEGLLQYVIYLMWITLAESWNLIGGYANLINLGMGAFFGIGIVLTSTLMFAGFSFPVAMILSGFAGAGLALVLTPTFRLRADYFAIGSLVIPLVLKPLVEYFGGKTSFDLPTGTFLNPTEFYLLGIVMAGGSIFGIFYLMRSRIGIALRSIGDDEAAAASIGINVLQYKMVALILSGFIASVAGSYYLGILGASNTSIFDDLTYSLFPAFMVVIGGIGTFEGPIVGALLFSAVSYGTVAYFQGSSFEVLVFSVMIMVVAVLLPRGIIPTLRRFIGGHVGRNRKKPG